MKSLPRYWRVLADEVNTEVNKLPYREDDGDIWDDMHEGTGDCDNYAIEKLRRLFKLEFPIERLRLATCFVNRTGKNKQGDGHLVLVIDALDDQYILDNRFNGLLTHPNLVVAGYVRDRIQEVGGSRNWIKWEMV